MDRVRSLRRDSRSIAPHALDANLIFVGLMIMLLDLPAGEVIGPIAQEAAWANVRP